MVSGGLFHKILRNCKLRICNYGQILIVNVLYVNYENSVTFDRLKIFTYYGQYFAVTDLCSLMEQVPGTNPIKQISSINLRYDILSPVIGQKLKNSQSEL